MRLSVIITTFLMMFVFAGSAHALAILGVDIGKSTINDVLKVHKISNRVKSQIKGYYYHNLDNKGLDSEFILDANLISDQNNVVEGVVLSLNTKGFYQIYNTIQYKKKLSQLGVPIKKQYTENEYSPIEYETFYIIINKNSNTITYVSKNYFSVFINSVRDYSQR